MGPSDMERPLRTLSRPVAGWLTGALASWGASQCAVCRTWPAHPVCDACVARFARPRPRCTRCALPVPEGVTCCGACLREPPPLDSCHAAVDYGWPWAGAIGAFKFEGETGWAAPLALLLRHAPWVATAIESADWLVPMPLSRERLAERGYNQSALLARRLDARRTRTDLLLRTRDTAPQLALGRAERRRNVRGAFAAEPLRAAQLRGRRVLLVDDVMTSGASLHAAAQALREAGVAAVGALVVARTPP